MVLVKKKNNSQLSSVTDVDDVPFTFAKSLLVQARNFGKDIDTIVLAAGFPFNPLKDAIPKDTFITIERRSGQRGRKLRRRPGGSFRKGIIDLKLR